MVKTENCHSSGHTEDKLTVAVRLRPLAPCESCQVAHVLNDKVVTLQDSATAKNDVLRKNRCQQRQFVFDVAFGEYISQREVYERTTQQLIADVLAGFNATVFAYGPTGSGKTHTMVGNDQQPGIMVRALNEIFHVMKERKNQSDFQMTLSYLEIYNENIRDLLNPSSGTLELREDAKRGAIEVTGLTAITTFNTKEVMKLLTKGNKERTMEATAANKTSSRSHAMLQVNVRQFCRVDGGGESVRTGRLYMIDLAGSERAKRTKNRGKRLQEGAHINRSLLALGNCINALTVKGNKYVNYRDSKLTRLLKDALSGNCRTVMIAHISPAACQREETFNTLVYADRAKNITNKVKPNALDVSHHVSQYQGIITELKEEICRLKTKLTDQNCSRSTCSSPALRNKHQEAEVRRMRGQLVDLFREQMELRQQLVEIDNVLLWLAMEFERQMFTISQHETEPTAEGVHLSDSDPSDSTDTDPDHSETESEEPPEVSQAWDDLQYIQDEEIKYQEMRKQVQDDLHQVKCKASEIEERVQCDSGSRQLICAIGRVSKLNAVFGSSLRCSDGAALSRIQKACNNELARFLIRWRRRQSSEITEHSSNSCPAKRIQSKSLVESAECGKKSSTFGNISRIWSQRSPSEDSDEDSCSSEDLEQNRFQCSGSETARSRYNCRLSRMEPLPDKDCYSNSIATKPYSKFPYLDACTGKIQKTCGTQSNHRLHKRSTCSKLPPVCSKIAFNQSSSRGTGKFKTSYRNNLIDSIKLKKRGGCQLMQRRSASKVRLDPYGRISGRKMLPDLASTDEERETIELLLKTHLLEIENVEMRRNQLVKDHELRRRDLMIIRYDKQRNLCDQIIERQQKLIHDMERGIPQSEQTAMPDELKEMYALYCQETNSVSRNSQFINQLSSILRTPSMLSLRGQLDTPFAGRHSDKSNDRERLPPISSQKEDRLFDHVDHTDSSLAERSHRGRSGTPLSIRSSSTSSSAHSTSTESRLPPINLSKQQQQQQQRYSVDLKHNNNRRLLRPHNNSSQLSSRELRSGLRSNSFDDLSGLREPTILNMSHWKTGRSDSCSSWSDIRESEGSVMTDSFPDLRLPDVVRSGHVMPMTRSHTDNVYSQRNLPSIDKRKMSVKESLI